MIFRFAGQLGVAALDNALFVSQIATCPFDWWLSGRIRLEAHIPRGFHVPRGSLVLANHRSLFDPFLITYYLGKQNWFATVPMRYPTSSAYARRPVLGRALKMLGAYDIGTTAIERAKKLLYTRDLLDRHRTVLLFPEGRIVNGEMAVDEFKKGAQMLFARDYPTIFVRLSGFDTQSFLKPETVTDARLHCSEVIRGDSDTKFDKMRQFFTAGTV
ncbi:MAG TPA: lysophospholipid acyltransferase family protein [Candidatus Paceibacterota bacterium]|nr:lysophospholipid acyltransferase family protein [Candidatus Paceibacterota bacterium]